MAYRTLHDETQIRLLGQALSGSYTQSWSKVFADAERIVYMLISHASCDVEVDISIATDSSGTSAEDILTAAVTADTAGRIYTFEIDAAQITAAKRYVSLKVTLSGGTYSLVEIKRGLRNQGNITQDSTWDTQTSQLG